MKKVYVEGVGDVDVRITTLHAHSAEAIPEREDYGQ